MTEWQPIETAPKDGTEILAFYPNWYGGGKDAVLSVHYDWGREGAQEDTWECDAFGHSGDSCTHWRPLPPPPT